MQLWTIVAADITISGKLYVNSQWLFMQSRGNKLHMTPENTGESILISEHKIFGPLRSVWPIDWSTYTEVEQSTIINMPFTLPNRLSIQTSVNNKNHKKNNK